MINQAIKSGLAPNVSDAHTINGHPGPVPNCPSQGNTCTPLRFNLYDSIRLDIKLYKANKKELLFRHI